jgi:hypothetical protein
MTDIALHDFGVVAEHGDNYEFHINTSAAGVCRLISVVQTERGPRRSELGMISGSTWRKICVRVVRELAQEMNPAERKKSLPSFKTGANRLSPLVGRELALLLWALEEEGAEQQLEAILHGWRELAREERWWLYAKAAAPGQCVGHGWRRGLFIALSEADDTRTEPMLAEKKSPGRTSASHSSICSRSESTGETANSNRLVKPLKRVMPKQQDKKRRPAPALTTALSN